MGITSDIMKKKPVQSGFALDKTTGRTPVLPEPGIHGLSVGKSSPAARFRLVNDYNLPYIIPLDIIPLQFFQWCDD